MNKLVISLVLLFAGLIAAVALSLDNNSRPTPAQDDVAYEEWQEMEPTMRTLVCNVYEMAGEEASVSAMINEGDTEGLAEARVDLMEREC